MAHPERNEEHPQQDHSNQFAALRIRTQAEWAEPEEHQGRKRIRLRAVDPKTGRMKEVDRIIDGSMDEALKLREELRTGLRNPEGVKAAMPRLGDYATSWLLTKKPSVKPSTARF